MKRETVEKYIRDIGQIALKSVTKGKQNQAMRILHTVAELQYEWNQNYTDEVAEAIIQLLGNQNAALVTTGFKPRQDVILFYDNFGLDTRGLALIYIKAICNLGYHLIYVVPKKAENNQPEIHHNTNEGNITFCYIEQKRGLDKVREIIKVFNKYMPSQAFFYTDPVDVEGSVSFACMKDKVVRYQVNLTDHAFWLGKSVLDYCIEFREYGACTSNKYRGIDPSKLVLLPYYPYIDKKIPFSGFDFDIKGKKILFSGGALYKTISDDHLYYHIVKELLERHDDLLFLYAGSGDDTELRELAKRYDKRVIHIAERKDLYEVMRHVTLYFNTYPIIGGLMTQYAAVAGLVPLTLVRSIDCSLDGLLMNYKELRTEFEDSELLFREADKLLNDDAYRQYRGKCVKGNVVTADEFQNAISQLLESRKTGYEYVLRDIDTTAFRRIYSDRFTEERLVHTIVKWKQPAIWIKYPEMVLKQLYNKFKK